MRGTSTAALLLIAMGLTASIARAAGDRVPAEEPSITPNFPAGGPTLGGKQFWADELLFHEWRIQRNAVTGHFRLLDEDNRRHVWGTWSQCRAELDRIRQVQHLPPMRGHAVLLLHGLADSRSVMEPLRNYLRKNSSLHVFNVSYPSTRQTIGDHARSLARIIENLEGIETISFVAHSMGNIVVRHYLADGAGGQRGRPDPRIRRMVMIGPPNHGSELATALADSRVFRGLMGKPGQELGSQWIWQERDLAVPQFEFGIIGGGFGNDGGLNPFVPGDDDGIVSVASTRLAGAADFAILPVLHAALPRHAKVQEYTLRFLTRGYFIAADKRNPIGEDLQDVPHP